jgi:hypothetical protein
LLRRRRGGSWCYGALGEHWALLIPHCAKLALDGDPNATFVTATPNETFCSEPDDSAAFQEYACYDIGTETPWCYGRLGDWWSLVVADCQLERGTSLAPEPSLHECGLGGDVADGWDEFTCFDSGGGEAVCYARRGPYWAGMFGVVHTCSLEAAGAPEVSAQPYGCGN